MSPLYLFLWSPSIFLPSLLFSLSHSCCFSLSLNRLIGSGMKQLIGKLNDLWPEHSVALSIPKEVDRSKEKLEGAWETTGIIVDRALTWDQYSVHAIVNAIVGMNNFVRLCVCVQQSSLGYFELTSKQIKSRNLHSLFLSLPYRSWWFQNYNSCCNARPRHRSGSRSFLYRHKSHRQWQLWCRLSGEALRYRRIGCNQKSFTRQTV